MASRAQSDLCNRKWKGVGEVRYAIAFAVHLDDSVVPHLSTIEDPVVVIVVVTQIANGIAVGVGLVSVTDSGAVVSAIGYAVAINVSIGERHRVRVTRAYKEEGLTRSNCSGDRSTNLTIGRTSAHSRVAAPAVGLPAGDDATGKKIITRCNGLERQITRNCLGCRLLGTAGIRPGRSATTHCPTATQLPETVNAPAVGRAAGGQAADMVFRSG